MQVLVWIGFDGFYAGLGLASHVDQVDIPPKLDTYGKFESTQKPELSQLRYDLLHTFVAFMPGTPGESTAAWA